MTKKLKKPVSILLSLIMVFSMFAIVPISAGATTYDSGYVDARNLQVGDIITGSAEYAYGFDEYTVVLKGGTYGEGYGDFLDEVCSEDRRINGYDFDLETDEGHLTLCDYDDWGEFVPVANNKIVDAVIILAKDGNTITLGGFDTNATFTVIWKNWDGATLETDANVKLGATPTYDGTTPEKAEDDDYVYEFAGWSPALIGVVENATYTATYNEIPKPKTIFAGHSITLDGNIGINFYISPYAAGMRPGDTGELEVNFEWAAKGPLVDVASQSTTIAVTPDNYKKAYDTIKVTCFVCAAEMTSNVKATANLNGATASEEYSVRQYCNTILDENSDFSKNYKAGYGTIKYGYLVDLVNKMLSYGAKAQTVFNINTGDLADKELSYVMQDVSSADFDNAINAANGGGADDIAAKATAFGASFKSASLVFLSENTLRLYFAKENDSFSTDGLTKWNDYFYAQSESIPAAQLDTLQEFTVSGTTLRYSALDYAKALATSGNSNNAALAKALYWYNQAANEFFVNLVDLGMLTSDYTAQDGDVISGTLTEDRVITIAPGATVTLKDADITSFPGTSYHAGITLLGDATILLKGTNTVTGSHRGYAGIYVPQNYTLTIDGTGSLEASSGNMDGGSATNRWACGIGSNNNGVNAGNIVINGGTITAIGGNQSAGIGSSLYSSCGDITINGGTVTAKCEGFGGAGIGGGRMASCGNILIRNTVTQVTATHGSSNGYPTPSSIGKGSVESDPNHPYSIGTVTIEDGANVIQN